MRDASCGGRSGVGDAGAPLAPGPPPPRGLGCTCNGAVRREGTVSLL